MEIRDELHFQCRLSFDLVSEISSLCFSRSYRKEVEAYYVGEGDLSGH